MASAGIAVPVRSSESTGGGTTFVPAQVTCHIFRTTGITTYLENDGDLETAQHIAGHASANTTWIYDHCEQKMAQEEIERVRI